jgi:hypothetical protein
MNALRTTFSLALASTALLFAPSASAKTTTQSRDLKGYSQIRLEGPLDLEVSEGSGYAFELTADDSKQDVFTTRVEKDTLVISTRRGLHWNLGEAKAKITLPKLAAVHVQGSGDVKVRSLASPHDFTLSIQGSGDVSVQGSMNKVTVSISGSGDVELSGGSAQALSVSTSGSGDVEAKDLPAKVVSVQTQGSGDVSATVTGGPAEFSTSGSGDIDWWGTAQPVQSHSSGSGDVTHH